MKGKCYWCNNITEISNVPVAGVRICDSCLLIAGSTFLKNVEYLKTLEIFKAEKTMESVLLIIDHLFNTYKEYLHIENERMIDTHENGT